MNFEESNKKIKKFRSASELKLQQIKQHSKLIDGAFIELNGINENNPDIVSGRINKISSHYIEHGF
ncbi:hypothetical protein SAMN05661096_01292 [Marivirga sericea]|jgi:hypothetical protein|uniref:Uncharacterized protein n=1 Tax=Marivirga sericea TaxID=1028 RepID=A0A1X7J5G5_9BACT|nr:hypothetical protein [Marivirga sericea]SMG22740.1 hypothetical protein SAMN05661096_01292 [Marivirga sericea]|tara:strand:+ start:19902 stop:20099 length:198 start_codon:yes stop_codon:yes gene_type:complete